MNIKKPLLLVITILAMFSVSAVYTPGELVRLTLVNKSGYPLQLSLIGEENGSYYYLSIPTGDQLHPTERVFTVVRDSYSSTLVYVQNWDPVYGYSCGSKSQTLDLTHIAHVTFVECDRTSRWGSDPPAFIKYGFGGRHRR